MDPVNGITVRDLSLRFQSVAQYSDDRNVLIYADYMLRMLSDTQRIALLVCISVVLVLAVLGNAATLVVNCKRKIRPFFRTCLLSLAFSDIITAMFQSMSYLAQLSTEFAPIWHLGEVLCHTLPFFTTTAILVNSFTLVGIAMDRYIAVVKMVKGAWEPSPLVCCLFAAAIWGAAAGIASPMISSYFITNLILIETSPSNKSQEVGVSVWEMCLSVKSPNQYYYSIVFLVIFVPMVIAFLWLNAIIAKEIWRRRRSIEAEPTKIAPPAIALSTVVVENRAFEDDEQSTGKRTTETNTISNEIIGKDLEHNSIKNPNTPATASAAMKNRSTREIRQLRMFRVILIIMFTFLVCRLPTWIYLLYKLDNVANGNIHWILQYVFGTLSVFNGVVNPLMYTFLTETIHISFVMFDRMKEWLSCGRCAFRRSSANGDVPATSNEPITKFYFSEDRKIKTARI